MNDMTATGTGKLDSDLKIVVDDARDLMRSTKSLTGDSFSELRSHIQTQADKAKNDLVRLRGSAALKTKALAHNTNVYVHQNPWKSVGFAAGVGVLMGILLRRK
jgi:ElaB/YqjD/DUF883 family membrane-anchored ribosome-binding protein